MSGVYVEASRAAVSNALAPFVENVKYRSVIADAVVVAEIIKQTGFTLTEGPEPCPFPGFEQLRSIFPEGTPKRPFAMPILVKLMMFTLQDNFMVFLTNGEEALKVFVNFLLLVTLECNKLLEGDKNDPRFFEDIAIMPVLKNNGWFERLSFVPTGEIIPNLPEAEVLAEHRSLYMRLDPRIPEPRALGKLIFIIIDENMKGVQAAMRIVKPFVDAEMTPRKWW